MNSCHTYHHTMLMSSVYICVPVYTRVSVRPSCFLARWGHDSCHLAARAFQSKLSAEDWESKAFTIIFCLFLWIKTAFLWKESIKPRLNSNEYHIHKGWRSLSRNTFPFPCGKPKFGTRFDAIRFQLRYCGAGELVVQMTCDCQNVVRHNERKLNHLSAFHFFIYTLQLWTFKIPSNKYTPVNMCFMTCATCIPDTS